MSNAVLAQAGDPAIASQLEHVRSLVATIPDPEIPVVSLVELGILRRVFWADGQPVVVLTPTYSGCPATEAITADVRATLVAAGYPGAQVRIELAPAWTTDWITDAGHRKLRAYGIAPPHRVAATADAAFAPTARIVRFQPKPAAGQPSCPRCDSPNVEQLSAYGSTPCKSLYRCRGCGEPFDYFKPY